MPPRDPAQYMRDYRARTGQKAPEGPAEKPARVKRTQIPEEPSRPLKVHPTGYTELPGDDWVVRMTQEQRDRILRHPFINKPGRRGGA